jgi:phosphoglycerate dehydrogenase-like enzyme
MPNVTITPHVAGESDGIEERMIQLFRENIRRFVEGLPLRNVVDKKAGY